MPDLMLKPSIMKNGKEYLSLTFVLFPKESLEDMDMNDSELLNYAKSVFLGTSKPASSFKERIILGEKINGEVLSTTIPIASDLEIHFITLQNGDKMCMGFKSIAEMPVETRESIIVEILGSLK